MSRALLPPDVGGTLGKEDNKWEDVYVDKINGVEAENFALKTENLTEDDIIENILIFGGGI